MNNKNVSCDYIIKSGDSMLHTTQRIEPPIVNILPDIIHEDENYFIVDKPPYMTVHTGGGYHYNTVFGLLRYKIWKKPKEAYVLHRIDKKTSGLLIMAKNRDAT